MHKQSKIELSIEWHARTKQFSIFKVFFFLMKESFLEKKNTSMNPIKIKSFLLGAILRQCFFLFSGAKIT